MGIYCDEDGQKQVSQPPTALYAGPPNLQPFRDICESQCWCVDIDDIPLQEQARTPAQCRDANADAARVHACQGTEFRDPALEENINCSPFYGSPTPPACNAALAQIAVEEHDPILENREFLPENAVPAYNGFQLENTPQYFPAEDGTVHACKIQVDMRTGTDPPLPASDLENWDYIWGRANQVIKKCVEGLGIGGWTAVGELEETAIAC